MRWFGSGGRFFGFLALAWPFLPLVNPWRFLYSRTPTGTAQTFVGDQEGLVTSSERITQSCPQLTWTRLRLEISGSWCMPVPKIVSPRLRQRVSSTPSSMVPSGQKVATTSSASDS